MGTKNDSIRQIFLSNEFSLYYEELSEKLKDKYTYAMRIIETQKIVSTKFVKKIQETEFYEVRVSIGTNEYRTLLVAIDNINFIEATKVVLLNSFQKKDTKQYRKEIEKARTIIIEEEII
jgi:hypothetical protein